MSTPLPGPGFGSTRPSSYTYGSVKLLKRTKFHHEEEKEFAASSSSSSSSSSSTPLSALPITNREALALSSSSRSSSLETSLPEEFIKNLVCNIEATILENPKNSTKETADLLTATDQNLLSILKKYRLSDLTRELGIYLKSSERENSKIIEQVFTKLYLNSLLNGEMVSVMKELEKNLQEMRGHLSPRSIGKMIKNFSLVLQPQKPNWEERDLFSRTLDRVVQIRNYTWYLDRDIHEKITLLIKHSLDGELKPMYPTCKNHFQEFCARLKHVTEKEINTPVLMNRLLAKRTEWQTQVKRSREPEVDRSEAEVFENRHIDSFWIAGAALVKMALENELSQRLQGTRMPHELVRSIEAAMRSLEMNGKFNFFLNQFRKSSSLTVSDRFIYEVMSNYFRRSDDFEPPSLVRILFKEAPLEERENLNRELEAIDQRRKRPANAPPMTADERRSWNQEKGDKILVLCKKVNPRGFTLTSLKLFCEGQKNDLSF